MYVCVYMNVCVQYVFMYVCVYTFKSCEDVQYVKFVYLTMKKRNAYYHTSQYVGNLLSNGYNPALHFHSNFQLTEPDPVFVSNHSLNLCKGDMNRVNNSSCSYALHTYRHTYSHHTYVHTMYATTHITKYLGVHL